jgi:hypothetical protein
MIRSDLGRARLQSGRQVGENLLALQRPRYAFLHPPASFLGASERFHYTKVASDKTLFRSRLLSLALVADATKDWQSRILHKARIGVRKFAAIECRSARRLDALRVHAVKTQSNAL